MAPGIGVATINNWKKASRALRYLRKLRPNWAGTFCDNCPMGTRSGRSTVAKSKAKTGSSKKSGSSSSHHVELTTGRSTDDLQQIVGNVSVGRMLQRRPDASGSVKDRKAAAKADARGEAELLAMTVEFAMSAPVLGPDDIAGLSPEHQSFIVHLYQVLRNQPFDKTKDSAFTAASREADLNITETMLPKIVGELALTSTGKALRAKLEAHIRSVTSDIVRNAVWVHSREDGLLAAQLVSRPVQEARESALAVVRQSLDIANKFLVVPAESGGELLGASTKDVNDGLGALVKVLKTVDPAEYRKSIDEAREYCANHGVALGLTKSLQVVAEITELTAGTAVSVGSVVSNYVVKVFGAGADLKALTALEEAGELVSTGNKVALKFAQVGEFLEKADKVLGVVAIAGGYAKLVTAESKFDKVDAVVDIGIGVASVAGKFAGEELVFGVAGGTLAAAASAVALPWMGVKYVKYLGEIGGAAIEGSLYGGLYEELREIQPFGDEVSRDMLVLASAIDERDRRAGPKLSGERSAGADEAVDDAARKLRKSLVAATNRWLRSRIDALGRFFPEGVKQSIEWAVQPEYPVESLVAAAGEFMTALTGAYSGVDDIALEMAVDQGFIDRDDVAAKKAEMHKAAKK